MAYQLSFAKLASYDVGQPGITIDVTLSLSDVATTFAAKIDTGASNCIFARMHGERLGLNIERGDRVRISTATGGFWAYRHEVTMTVLDYSFDVRVLFAEDAGFNQNVLGRFGWLDRMILGIVDYAGKLYLSRYGEE